MDECLFCKIVAGDMPAQKVYEDEHVLAFLDINPVNPGHTLIIPKAHSENMMDASPEDVKRVAEVAQKIAPGILKAVGADSYNFTTNVGRAAGQIVFHTHFHLIPRFPADGYQHWSREDDEHIDLEKIATEIKSQL